MTGPWDAATGDAIGATWLLAAIAPAGSFGRRARARERPFLCGDENAAREAIARVASLAAQTSAGDLAAMRAAIARAPDLTDIFVRATGGASLDDVDFFELGRLARALDDVAAFVARAPFAAPAIAEVRVALAPGTTNGYGFYLADAFDATLARERLQAVAAVAAFDLERSRLDDRVAAFAGVERVRDGEFVLMRDAVAGTLPPEIRVLREAPTYFLCEVALDDGARAALTARDDADVRVASAEEAVRARLTRVVADAVAAFGEACDALGDLDALVARAQFAHAHACVVPEIATDGGFAIVDAAFAPLRETLAGRGRAYAPVSLDLDGIGVVTGPNMGGKTVALRTLGFIAACVALGVPVPARSARVVLVDEIVWLGIGASSDADDGLLSSFGREVIGLRSFLARDARRAIVLVDEFARTTSPREGRALSIALLERLRERGAFGLAATHLAGIAGAAKVAHFAVGGLRALNESLEPLDLDAALARIALAMDYRITRVDEDAVSASDALELGAALGLDVAFVTRARAALGDARTPG